MLCSPTNGLTIILQHSNRSTLLTPAETRPGTGRIAMRHVRRGTHTVDFALAAGLVAR